LSAWNLECETNTSVIELNNGSDAIFMSCTLRNAEVGVVMDNHSILKNESSYTLYKSQTENIEKIESKG
jgi:hypothetical protein